MKVRDLITTLLDMPMDAEILTHDETEHLDEYGGKCSGYVFDIYKVHRFNKNTVLISFEDWRHTNE